MHEISVGLQDAVQCYPHKVFGNLCEVLHDLTVHTVTDQIPN